MFVMKLASLLTFQNLQSYFNIQNGHIYWLNTSQIFVFFQIAITFFKILHSILF